MSLSGNCVEVDDDDNAMRGASGPLGRRPDRAAIPHRRRVGYKRARRPTAARDGTSAAQPICRAPLPVCTRASVPESARARFCSYMA